MYVSSVMLRGTLVPLMSLIDVIYKVRVEVIATNEVVPVYLSSNHCDNKEALKMYRKGNPSSMLLNERTRFHIHTLPPPHLPTKGRY